MQIYRILDGLELKGSCLAIGVFDGVHRGHQAVLRAAAEAARRQPQSAHALALTFDRHPAELLAPQHAPPYVCSLEQRLEWMRALGVLDAVVAAPFDLAFSYMSPRAFIENVLVARLGAKAVLVGADFRFGKDRKGTVMDLEAAGDAHGFDVRIIHPITAVGERVSSTRIRDLIQQGQVSDASNLLGRAFTLRGTVVVGKRLGRTIGFPTANLLLDEPRQAVPSHGVYAGRLRALGETEGHPAAISVGTNPTTDGAAADVKIEAFVLGGFERDLYGSRIDLEFAQRLRGQLKFESLEALKGQIKQDVALAETILGGG